MGGVIRFERTIASSAVITKLVELGYPQPGARHRATAVARAIDRLRNDLVRQGVICDSNLSSSHKIKHDAASASWRGGTAAAFGCSPATATISPTVSRRSVELSRACRRGASREPNATQPPKTHQQPPLS